MSNNIATKAARLNPFEIRALVQFPVLWTTTAGIGLNPFEIRALVQCDLTPDQIARLKSQSL